MQGVEISPSKEGVIYGGVENSVLRLAKELDKQNVHTDIVTNDKRYRESYRPTTRFSKHYSDFHFTLVNGDYAGLRYSTEYLLKTVYMTNMLAKSDSEYIIHGHSGLLKLIIATELSALYCRLPAIHTVYCPVQKNPQQKILQKLSANHISEFIAISDNVKRSLINIGVGERKISVIPPIVDYSEYYPGTSQENIRSKYGIEEDDFLILYLGNMSETKCITEVLKSLGEVKDNNYDFTLLSGVELTESIGMELSTANTAKRQELHSIINRSSLEGHIVNLGPIENVAAHMDEADVVVAPFKHTNHVADYPLTIVEAMATGTPVITSPVGGIPELITDGESGIFVSPTDHRHISNSLIELINDPKKTHQIGETAARSIREKIDNGQSVQMILDLYNRLSK